MKNIKERFDIGTIEEFKKLLIAKDYKIDEKDFYNYLKDFVGISNEIIEEVLLLEKEKIIYRVSGIEDFIHYMKSKVTFKLALKSLEDKLKTIDKLIISRKEYEKEKGLRGRVENIDKEKVIGDISLIKEKIEVVNGVEYLEKINKVYDEIKENFIFSNDIELLKKILLKDNYREVYDEKNMIRFIEINIDGLNKEYIKSKKGGVEYHQHIDRDILKIKRLIKNLDKHLEYVDGIFYLNQSNLVQDTVNIAIAKFNDKDYKAISGQINLKGYCIATKEESFKSFKVNKKGEIGTGYNRFNDSEKKIFETIHKDILEGRMEQDGEIILYSKLEPCPSCYYVMSQFKRIYPQIKIKLNYGTKYGEK